MMLLSLDIVEFKQAIISYVNQTEMPMEIKRMAFKEIYDEIQTAAHQEVKREFDERQKVIRERQRAEQENQAEESQEVVNKDE